MKNAILDHEFYCTSCQTKGIPIVRMKGKERPAGHLKKLYCLTCKREVNFVECRPYSKYTFEDFQVECEFHNFDEEGNRKMPYGLFKEQLRKEGKIYV